MLFSGFADEAGKDIDTQIRATRELGWRHIETRAVGDQNITLIDPAEFERVAEKLAAAGITVSCLGSGIANWAKKITEPPDSSYQEMRQAIPRMHTLGTRFIRIMSFAVPPEVLDRDWSAEAIKRIKVIVKLAEDGGVVCLHENCSGWGALSYEHTLRLLEAIPSPALKLVYDTGNPPVHDDVRGRPPYRKQDAWEFYRNVRPYIEYVHVKDDYMKDGKEVYTFPGEGQGYVRETLTDLLKTGYDGGFSIEPHMAVVFHDSAVTSSDEIRYRNYVEYGRRLEKMLAEIKAELGR